MLTLETAQTLRGKAGTAAALTYTIVGDEVPNVGGLDAFKVNAQGQLTGTTATLYTVPAGTQTLVKEIHVANTTGLNVSGVVFYVGGSASNNQLTGTIGVPANGTAIYDGTWHVYDSSGILQFVGSTGPSGTLAVGTVTNIGSAGPPTVTNVGTPTAAVLNFGLQQGATGSTGAPGVVQDVLATDTTIVISGTATHPTVARAALTGDVTTSLNVATIKNDVALAGNPTTTTQAANNNSTRVSTTAYVDTADALKANLASPTFTGDPKAPTPAPGDNDTSVATTAFATAAIAVAGASYVPVTRTVGTTAPLTGGGALSSNLTLAVSPATTSTAGTQSANDKKKSDDLWYDVTCWSPTASENLVGDNATDNGPKWATFFAALPVGAVVYFPPGTYRTSTAFAITADKHLRVKGANKYESIIRTTSTTADGFTISGGQYWYNTFEDLKFDTTMLNKTAGSAILISTIGLGANAQQAGINIYRCAFSNWFKAIYCIADTAANNGATQGPGNLSVWSDLDISITGTTGPANSRGIHINGAGTNLMIANTFVNFGFPPFNVAGTACFEINASGAIQFINGEYIGGANTMLLSADATTGTNNSVAAVYATNCFFDQSAGSTLKIAGANIVNRVKFVQCGITGGNVASATAVEIASAGSGAAGTGTAKADGVDFFDCDIYPNGGSGTTNGFLITGAQGVTINACRISGWTNGIAVTPSVSAGYTKIFVTNNKIGATNNFTTPNTNGLVLNAGSFTYGAVVVTGNDFTGSTAPLTENAAVVFANQEIYESNIGIVNSWVAPATAATQAFAGSGTGFINGTTIPIPTGGFRIGSTFRWTVPVIKTAGTAITFAIRYGTTNTFAGDTVNIGTAAFTGTAVGDGGVLTVTMTVLTLGAAATALATFSLQHGGTTTGWVTTLPGALVQGTMTAFNTTLTAPYLNLGVSASTATAFTVQAPTITEILR